ncbi:MAG: alanyl-tRNA editing protein [bacterium]|nr:alanyl-tRNA editing protein [bacterium]
MSRILAYEREPYRRELEVEVVAVGEHEGRAFAELGDTILYPEGGGQPADHGRLGEVAVVDVRRAGDVVRHFVERPVEVGRAALALDWRRRFDHMQQHTAQHLLTAVAADRFGWQTTSFHLSSEVCDIELDAGNLAATDLAALEEAVNAEVRAARPVTARRVEPEELVGLGVRSRGLPAGHRGSVRLVEIEGLDRNTCGGTHLASTAEIECVKLLDVEPKRGGSVLRWVAGMRVRRRLAEWEARGGELRRTLGCADEELAGIAALKLDQLQAASRHARALEGRLAEAVAEGLAARSEPVVDAHFDDADAGFLQQIARRFSASDHPGVALLTATGGKGAFFVVAGGGGGEADVQAAGRRVAEALDARGGGSGRIFQGKVQGTATSPAGREAALEVLAAALS